jgi:DNA-binding transcriptional ArsR family regulator
MVTGDIVLRDPRALRALAHPIRLAILERLQGEGSATATEIGEVVGVSASAASYHLRSLGRFGLVEDAGGGRGRNRPWRAIGTGFRFEPADHLRPAAQAAVQLLGAQLVARGERATLEFIQAESKLEPEWRAASHIANATLRLTASEAIELVHRIDAIVEPYLRSTRVDVPADARATRLLLRLFPHDLPSV